jgi:AraC-like DNA-binding protein
LISVPGTSDVNLEYLLLFAGEQQRVSAKIDIDSSASRRVLAIMGRMSDELCGQEMFFRMAAKNHLCSILLILNRAAALTPVVTPHVQLRLRDLRKLQPAFDRIHHRFSERLALSDLAEAVEMSVAQLCRYFKRVTGQTVSEYVRRYRIDRAKELLIGDIHSITWIAYEVGFESHSYFDRVFNQVTRQTPQEFRKSYARRLPVEDGTAGHPRG